jgi:hypothetical protein
MDQFRTALRWALALVEEHVPTGHYNTDTYRDAQRLLASNVIPTGTSGECPACFGPWSAHAEECPNRHITRNPEERPEISNDPTKAEPAFRAWLEGFDPDALKQLVGPGITPGRVHEYQSAFYAGRVSLWAEALSHQRGTQPDPERRLRVSKTPYGDVVLTLLPSGAASVFAPVGSIGKEIVGMMADCYETHRT